MQESTGRHAEADEEEAHEEAQEEVQLRQELSSFLQETDPQMHSQDLLLDAWTRPNTGGDGGSGEGFLTSNNSFDCR